MSGVALTPSGSLFGLSEPSFFPSLRKLSRSACPRCGRPTGALLLATPILFFASDFLLWLPSSLSQVCLALTMSYARGYAVVRYSALFGTTLSCILPSFRVMTFRSSDHPLLSSTAHRRRCGGSGSFSEPRDSPPHTTCDLSHSPTSHNPGSLEPVLAQEASPTLTASYAHFHSLQCVSRRVTLCLTRADRRIARPSFLFVLLCDLCPPGGHSPADMPSLPFCPFLPPSSCQSGPAVYSPRPFARRTCPLVSPFLCCFCTFCRPRRIYFLSASLMCFPHMAYVVFFFCLNYSPTTSRNGPSSLGPTSPTFFKCPLTTI